MTRMGHPVSSRGLGLDWSMILAAGVLLLHKCPRRAFRALCEEKDAGYRRLLAAQTGLKLT